MISRRTPAVASLRWLVRGRREMSKRRKPAAARQGGNKTVSARSERGRASVGARGSGRGVAALARWRPLCALVAVVTMVSVLGVMLSGSRVGMFGLGTALFGRRAAGTAARAASSAADVAGEYAGSDRDAFRVQRRLPHDKDAFT